MADAIASAVEGKVLALRVATPSWISCAAIAARGTELSAWGKRGNDYAPTSKSSMPRPYRLGDLREGRPRRSR